jgi:serine/threonine protein kinase
MSTDRQRKIRELFDAACDLPASEQLEWLSQQPEPPELVEQVSKLLAAARQSSDFLAKPAIRRHDPAEREGRRIGAYKVLRELQSGGMGVVYLCRRDDDVFQRQVALKVIRTDVKSPEMIARFEAERQTLADLDHTNIARIVDGGTTEDGLPYLVMDYIEGVAIDKFCNQRQATLTQRINLARQLCMAVQYLHDNYVLHRDLKPSNILVTRDGLVKLLDFGIAKHMDKTLEVAATVLPFMTPRFASPEQMLGKPMGPASDVYSLAAILYLLLTGRCPLDLDGKTLTEISSIVTLTTPMEMSAVLGSSREADEGFQTPVPIPQWSAALKGNLDRIVAMALRLEPSRRYASAMALADDLRRHQQDEPVLARGNSPAYLAASFVRRNRLNLLAGLIVAASLSLAVVFAGIAYSYRKEVRDLARAEAAAQQVLASVPAGSPGQVRYVQHQAQRIQSDYQKKILPMLSNPLAPRHEIASTAENSVDYLSNMTPLVGSDPDAARSLADAYLTISKLQWSNQAESLHDPAAANRTARTALRELMPYLATEDGRRSLAGFAEAVEEQARASSGANSTTP